MIFKQDRVALPKMVCVTTAAIVISNTLTGTHGIFSFCLNGFEM